MTFPLCFGAILNLVVACRCAEPGLASTTVHDLRTLIRSSHPLIVIGPWKTVLTLPIRGGQERMPLFEVVDYEV